MMALGGWASRTAESKLREEMVREGIDTEASARSATRNSERTGQYMQFEEVRRRRTNAVVQKH